MNRDAVQNGTHSCNWLWNWDKEWREKEKEIQKHGVSSVQNKWIIFLHERKKGRVISVRIRMTIHKQWYCYNVTSSQHNGIPIEIIVNILLWKKPLSSSFCVRNHSFDHLKFKHWPNNWLNSSFSVLYLVMYLATMEWNECDSNVIALHSVAHLKYNRWW